MARRKAEPLKNSWVHRFHDRVAVSLPGGDTKYLTAKEARQLARAMNRCAWDISTTPKFSESHFGTTEVELSDPFRQNP